MVYKRGYDDDEESYEIAPKHRRQEEDHTAQLSPILENDPCNDGSQRLSSDGEGENSFGESQDERKVSKDMVNESLDGVNSASQYSPFGNTSNYWWFDNKLSDEFSDLNGAHDLSFFPNYFEIDDCVESTGQPEKICETLMDHSSRKGVPIGPEYQADIPVWSPQDPKNSVSTNIAGTCVIPMPDPESSVFNCELGDQTDRDCTYADNGSIDRVRQHVLVARDALREKLGKEVYEELGFCDMGEEVAKKWSEEEQQAFHEVVFSNPISSGKNFWDHLPYVFPSRTKRDHVSYYFNVFMLRIRAEQNRFDPLNTDSDNDEWQGSEFGIMEQGEDSVFESLPSHAAPCNQENYEEDLVEASENKDETNCASLHELNKDETNCASLPELFGKMSNNYKVDQDTQDYSSTLYEDQSEPVNLGILENLINSDFSS